MYNFKKVKLVIWDLDETFWKGTISEEKVNIPNTHINLIKKLTDIGIVNAICSKNDVEPVEAELKSHNLFDYFVFNSINWEPKGARVKQLIKNIQLRPENVLFIDDNHSNIEEVKYFSPEIMAEGPEIIQQLYNDAMLCENKDIEHKRLKQYKVLETKNNEKLNYTSNEDFLIESNIQVEILHNCNDEIERIHDLVLRSNQLNFTKIRSTIDELKIIFNDESIQKGYVSVSDRFGDYGIVGFYALKDNQLIHFTFSCRILGMGIEQYVYNTLGRPKLNISGEVISDLSSKEVPKWINREKVNKSLDKMTINNLKEHMVLIKGPCDLFQIFPYISQTDYFDTEFTYVVPNSNLVIEGSGHTTNIVESIRLTKEQKDLILSEVPFTDKGMYSDKIIKNNYKVVFISILVDANYGVYKRKETGEKIAFLEYIHPITDPESWSGLIDGTYNTCNFKFNEEILKKFSEKYEFIGRNTPEQIVENIKYIRKNLSEDCLLVIMLGGELYYEKNTYPAYKDRHIVHKNINDALRKLADEVSNIKLLDVNKYIVDQSSFYDHFNHYTKPVYYSLAGDMVDIINDWTGSKISEKSKLKMVQIVAKEKIAPLYYKILKLIKRI
ncbi:MAG: HAD-IIIC family phosphatase [Acutalibacteraceae bacterium]|nr:HAD-IIIC family phosphatase [Acutalibacteraceae bacterium]